MSTTAPGQVIGTVAGSLNHSGSWLPNQSTAKVGAKGEKNTGSLLNRLAAQPGGPSVIHDLRIPIPGVKANIDHLVVSGRTVTLIDSKVWKPGFYWTLAGFTFRGGEHFPPAEKKTMPMAYDAITRYLAAAGVRAIVRKPLLVVWPSGQSKTLRLALLRSPGARAVTGEQLKMRTAALCGARPADADVLSALAQLAIKSR